MKVFAVLSAVLAAVAAAPQYPAGVAAAICPNYPFCGATPGSVAEVPGIDLHNAAVALHEQQKQTLQFTVGPAFTFADLRPQVPGYDQWYAAQATQLAAQGMNPGIVAHAGEIARVKQAEGELLAFAGLA